MQTSCRDCVFKREYNKNQVGCYLARLDVYKQNNVDIDEGYDDEGREFSVINGCCVFARNRKWEMAQKERIHSVIWQETSFKCDILIYYDNHMLDQLKTTLASLHNQYVSFINKIVLVTRKTDNEAKTTLKNSGFPWRIETIIEADKTKDQCYDMAQKHCDSMYYAKLDAGTMLPNNILREVQLEVYDKCKPLVLINFNGGCLIYRKLHESLSGNGRPAVYDEPLGKLVQEATTFEQEVEKFAKENGEEHTVWTVPS